MFQNRRFFCYFFRLVCVAFFFVTACCAAPDKETTDRKVERLSKEIKELNQSFRKAQERLSSIAKQLDHWVPSSSVSTLKPLSFGVSTIEKVTHHLKLRFQEFIQGLENLVQLLNQPLPSHFSWHVLQLFISAVLGGLGVYVGHFLILKNISHFLEQLRSKRVAPLSRLVFLSAALALPLAGFFMLSLCVLFLLEGIQSAEKLVALYSQRYALLPVDLYVVWAGFFAVSRVCSPQNPSMALLPLDARGAKEASFWLRLSFLIYFFGKVLLYLCEIFPKDTLIAETVSGTVGIMIGLCLSHALRLMIAHCLQHSGYAHTLRGLSLMRWSIFIFCALWLLTHRWFHHFLIPAVVTGCAIALIAPVKNGLMYGRVRFLWKSRHKDTSVSAKKILGITTFLENNIHSVVYFILFCVWWIYLWDLYDFNWFFDFAHWLQGFLFSPFMGNVFNAVTIFFLAMLFVKIGERILKYYVEDKYPTDSHENNFLASRLKTLMAMLRTLLRIVIWLPAINIIFSQFGEINITAWITSIGAASFGLTFGFQSIVRDFITGFFIILENNLMVGDEVDVDGRTGKVEEISMRTLKIRSDQGVLLTIPFGNILVIGNKNRIFSALVLNISVGYNENIDKIQRLIEKAFGILKRTPILGRRVLGNLELRGVKEVTSYSMVMQVKIKTAPNMQESVHRAFTRILKQVFDEAEVVVPTAPHPVTHAEPSLTHTVL